MCLEPSSKSAGSSGNGSGELACGKLCGRLEMPASLITGLAGRAIMFAMGAGLLTCCSKAGGCCWSELHLPEAPCTCFLSVEVSLI